MTEITEDRQLKWAQRVEHMLRLAENAGTAEEAQTFTERAQAVMQEHMVTEELLAKARGEELPDVLTQEDIEYTGIFQAALFDVGQAIARQNNLRVLISKRTYKKPSATALIMVGFKSDIERVRLLDASVQIQLSTALRRWWSTQDSSWMSKMDQFKARREFIFGFAHGLGVKLATARRAGEQAAREAEVERTGDVETSTRSVELVLVSRKQRVDEWYDEKYGTSTRSVSRRYQSGGRSARQAGHEAGLRVDTGQPRIGGRRAIEGR